LPLIFSGICTSKMPMFLFFSGFLPKNWGMAREGGG